MEETGKLAIKIMVYNGIPFDWEILNKIESEIKKALSK